MAYRREQCFSWVEMLLQLTVMMICQQAIVCSVLYTAQILVFISADSPYLKDFGMQFALWKYNKIAFSICLRIFIHSCILQT